MIINIKRPVKNIIIHCSDSKFGDADLIKGWHREGGFDTIGYHYVILNGYAKNTSVYIKHQNGMIEFGRDLDTPGAHVKGANEDSIGICLIGVDQFTQEQLISLESILVGLLGSVLCRHQNEKIRISGHNEWDKTKTCPNLDVKKFVMDRPRIYNLLDSPYF